MAEQEEKKVRLLQEIDSNFVQALEAGSKLLQHVKTFDRKMQEIAQCVSVWSKFFDHIHQVNVEEAIKATQGDEEGPEEQTPQEILKEDGQKQQQQQQPRRNQQVDQSQYSEVSNDNPPTPKLPSFSKSFARTPMGRKLRRDFGLYSDDEDDDLNSSGDISSVSFLGKISPATARLVEKYDETPQQQRRGVNVSDLSAMTPETPEEGDYGTSPNAAAEQLLEFGTPATHKQVARLLLSSIKNSTKRPSMGRNFAKVNESSLSDSSSNPATPTLNSPFMLGGTMDQENDATLFNSQNSGSSGGARKRSFDEASAAGTPLSKSIASKKSRKSLTLQQPKFDDVMMDDDDDDHKEQEGDHLGNNDELEDIAPQKFDLKLFPKIFQSGDGAKQVTTVFKQFQTQELTLTDLSKTLPDFGVPRLELMLEMLVSRGLLRPFQKNKQLLWKLHT